MLGPPTEITGAYKIEWQLRGCPHAHLVAHLVVERTEMAAVGRSAMAPKLLKSPLNVPKNQKGV